MSLKVRILGVLGKELLILVVKVLSNSYDCILVAPIELNPLALHGLSETNLSDLGTNKALNIRLFGH